MKTLCRPCSHDPHTHTHTIIVNTFGQSKVTGAGSANDNWPEQCDCSCTVIDVLYQTAQVSVAAAAAAVVRGLEHRVGSTINIYERP